MDVYISPHFDDVIFSLGSHIMNNTNKKIIITLFTKENRTKLHELKGVNYHYGNYKQRKIENVNAIFGIKNCDYKNMEFDEALFRNNKNTNILTEDMYLKLNTYILTLKKISNIYVPLGIGLHIDHIITYNVCSNIQKSIKYYYEFPYYQIDLNKKIRNLQLGVQKEDINIGDLIEFYNAPIYSDNNWFLRIFLLIYNIIIYVINYVFFCKKTINSLQVYNIDLEEKMKLVMKYKSQIVPIFGNYNNLYNLLKRNKEIVITFNINE